MFSAINLWAKDETAVLKIGLIQSKHSPSSKIHLNIEDTIFNFYYNESELVLLNQLISGQIDMAILSTEYALKALWYGHGCQIIAKAGPKTKQLLTRKQTYKKLNKFWFKDKKILLIKNSAEEYYLKQYFQNLNFKKTFANSNQKKDTIKNSLNFNGEPVDAVFEENFNNINKANLDMTPVPFGDYFVVARHAFASSLKNGISHKAFASQKLSLNKLKKADVYEIKKINDFLVKKIPGDAFDISFSEMMNHSE